MSNIVCDTVPVLHLSEAGLLELLLLPGEAHIPDAVHAELIELLQPSWERQRPPWLSVHHLAADEAREAELLSSAGLMDVAEAGAILLARRMQAWWFLTDDASARIYAASLGLEVHGSLGVVLWAAATGKRDHESSRDALHRLSKTSLWISRGVLSEAQEALRKIFERP